MSPVELAAHQSTVRQMADAHARRNAATMESNKKAPMRTAQYYRDKFMLKIALIAGVLVAVLLELTL